MIVSDVHHDVSEPTKRRDPTRLSDPKSPGSDYAPIVSVSLDFEAWDWSFMTMPGAILRIIMNIFGNAQKYTNKAFTNVSLQAVDGEILSPDGSDRSQIKTAMMILLVWDSGCGMPSEFLQNLYTPFVQESTLSAGAAWIFHSHSILNQLFGSIKVHSFKNKGTEVEIRVPIKKTFGWNMIQRLNFQPEDISYSTFQADKRLVSVRKLASGVYRFFKGRGDGFCRTPIHLINDRGPVLSWDLAWIPATLYSKWA